MPEWTLEQFYLTKHRYIRLVGCNVYMPDATAPKGYRRLEGGRTVYLEHDSKAVGLAVVNRRVVSVVTTDREAWHVVEEQEQVA